MHLRLLRALCLLLLLAVELQGEPISLHPDNPHYFLYRGRPTVLITSAEHYGSVLNLDFDYVRYLDALKANRLNHTRTFTGTYFENPGAFNIAENTLAPRPDRYIGPWERSDIPGYAGGGNKFDLAKWNQAYFARWKEYLTHAAKRGVVVEVTLFCPFYDEAQWELNPQNMKNNINGVGKVNRTNVFSLTKSGGLLPFHESFVRKIVRELNAFDNIYYEVCNEPYVVGVEMAWQHRIIDVIRETEANLPKKHLISLNVANGSARITNAHPGVSIFNFHYATPPTAVAENYHLNKVIGDNETGFRGTNDLPYRVEGWDFLVAGGALFNNLDYSFTTSHPDGKWTSYPATQPGGGSPAFRKQLQILRDFLYSFNFVNMSPATEVIASTLPAGISGRALAETGKQYAIYLAPRRSEHHQFSARWEGSLVPTEDGLHELITSSNDGIRLWLENKLLIENWTSHPATENSNTVTLVKGKSYPIKVEYYQGGGGAEMKLMWKTPSGKREIIPSQALRTTESAGGLQATYFTDTELREKKMTRLDPEINFVWTGSSPFDTAAVREIGKEFPLQLRLPSGTYKATWIEPKSGKVLKREKIPAKEGIAEVTVPAFEEDLALRLVR